MDVGAVDAGEMVGGGARLCIFGRGSHDGSVAGEVRLVIITEVEARGGGLLPGDPAHDRDKNKDTNKENIDAGIHGESRYCVVDCWAADCSGLVTSPLRRISSIAVAPLSIHLG